MKKPTIAVLIVCGAILTTSLLTTQSQEAARQPKGSDSRPVFEYATARFMEEKTSIVWPDGKVENVLQLNGKQEVRERERKISEGSRLPDVMAHDRHEHHGK